MHETEHIPFEERLEHALADEQMHSALTRFAPSWSISRGAALYNRVLFRRVHD
jgi:hypothetical protein